MGYQYVFPGDSATNNSSSQKTPTNETSANAVNGSANPNIASNKNQKNNRQK